MKRLEECRRKVEDALDYWLPKEGEKPSALHQAMRYAVFAGGKRLRPFLVLECCRAVGGDENEALPAACAVEVLHTYSLVHDDLPCMDDDDFRRGKPTCHKVFGEGMAVLCGDALLTLAFDLLAAKLPQRGVDAETTLQVIATLSEAASSRWLIGGQALDITGQENLGHHPSAVSVQDVKQIHERKTAALMKACCFIGGLLGGAKEGQLKALSDYGYWLGLAFQITDDILDITGDPEKLGKSVGKDQRQKKLTYPMVAGLKRSQELAEEAVHNAVKALGGFDDRANNLRALAHYLLERQG